MKVLYIGEDSAYSTSYNRAAALSRIGNEVEIINPYLALKNQLSNPILGRLHYYSGYRFIQKKVLKWLRINFSIFSKIDIIWVNSGELFGNESIEFLKSMNVPVILYNNDDPTGGRDGHRFDSLLKAISYYDLCVVMRNQNIVEYYERGAQKVIRLQMSYDEVIHKAYDSIYDIQDQFKSDVAFIGTWMRYEKRDEFLIKLIDSGINISIWGDRWERSPYWNSLKKYYKGKSLKGREYVAAIQGAKICLGMLSKGNRDLHTTRSLEIPYAGGLLCAERTSEHLSMYEEGVEAIFWDNAVECASICKQILSDDILRNSIRNAGMKKVREIGVGNEDICKKIISEINNIKC